MEVEIYYGMSGAMKSATIDSKLSKYDLPVMRSKIKSWKKYQTTIFDGLTEYNDLNYGILHLVGLESFLSGLCINGQGSAIIERGISDSIFYHTLRTRFPGSAEDLKAIESAIQEELNLLRGCKVRKNLLVQEDTDFIRDVVLKDQYRAGCFKDVNDYLEKQRKYVRFTEEYNKIDSVVKIENAKDYIEKVLGQKFMEHVD